MIHGRLVREWRPWRNPLSRYYLSLDEYRPSTLPDFTTGQAYLFPADVARDLYEAALERPYLKLEDVFVTGIVADAVGVGRVHTAEFYNQDMWFPRRSVHSVISIHGIDAVEQFYLWREQFNGGSTPNRSSLSIIITITFACVSFQMIVSNT